MAEARAELAGRIMGFMLSQAVYVAAKLRIPDLIAEGRRSPGELADATGAHGDSLYRLLRMLAGHGVFVEDADGFANSELSELLRDVPGSARDFALIFGEEFYPALGGLLRSVESGEPAFDALFGAPFDDYLATDAEKSARFNRFMAGGKAALAEVLAAGEWRGDETVVDVGGGNGALLRALLEHRPGLRGVVLDLPHVAAEAAEAIRAACLDDRCTAVGGSYFDGVPAGEVYVLSHILHGWDDDRALEILRVIRSTIPEHGRVLVVDAVLGGPNEPEGKLMDLLMLSVGGRERAEGEWRALLGRGGFELTGIRAAPFSHVLDAAPR
jgi:hypothetical protein